MKLLEKYDVNLCSFQHSTANNTSIIFDDMKDIDIAKKIIKSVDECVVTLGLFMDLSTLDGITIACDYDAALAAADQGIQCIRPLDRTDTDEIQGVAKTFHVWRNEKVKSHIIFDAAVLLPLLADNKFTQEEQQCAIGIIAHECGHVHMNAQIESFIPDARFGAKIKDPERAILFQIAEICWEEYAVCHHGLRFVRMCSTRML